MVFGQSKKIETIHLVKKTVEVDMQDATSAFLKEYVFTVPVS